MKRLQLTLSEDLYDYVKDNGGTHFIITLIAMSQGRIEKPKTKKQEMCKK
jgi:hypothetical protein